MDLESMLGHATAIMEVSRESGNIVGNSLKTIYSRITTMNQSVELLEQAGVSTRDVAGNLLPVEQILEDLAGRWNTLGAESQQALGLQLAGRFQLSRFLTLMQQWEQAEASTAAAINSNGSALRENERYLQSHEAKINQMTNSVTGLFIALGESFANDSIVLFVEGMTNALKSVTLLVDTIGGVPTVLLATAPLFVLLNKNIMGYVTASSASSKATIGNVTAIRQLILAKRNLQASTASLTGTLSIFSTKTSASTKAIQAQAVATNLLSTAARGLGVAIRGMLASTGVGLGLVAIGYAIEKLIGGFAEAKAQAKEIEDDFNKSSESIRTQGTEIGKLSERFRELEEIREANGKLDNSQEEEYKNLQAQLAEILPSVATGLDEKGNSIVKNSEVLEDQIKLLKEKIELEKVENRQSFDADFSEINNELDRTDEKIKKTEEKAALLHKAFKQSEEEYGANHENTQYFWDDYIRNENKVSKLKSENIERQIKFREILEGTLDSTKALTDEDVQWLSSLKSDGKITNDELFKIGSNLDSVRDSFGNLAGSDYGSLTAKQVQSLADVAKAVKEGGQDWDTYADTLKGVDFSNTDKLINSLKDSVKTLQDQVDLGLFEDAEGQIPIASTERLNELNEEGTTLYIELNGQIVEYTDNMNLAGQATDTFADTVESLYDAYDQTSSEMSILNGLLDDIAAGNDITATEIMKHSKSVSGLVDNIEIENGVIKLNEQGIEQLRQAKMKAYTDMIEAERKSLLATGDAVKEKLKSYGIEIQAIKSVADAKQELARLDEEIYNANASIGYGGEESSADIYRANMIGQARREVSDFSEQLSTLDKLSELAGSSLSTVGSEIENTANASSDAADSQKDQNDQTKEALYITDEYRNKMARFNAEQAKLNRLKSQYAQHSKKYRDAIQKEIDLLERQRSAQQDQVDDLNNQIKTGNYKQTGMQSWTSGSTGYNQNGELVTRVSEPAVRASGGNQQHTVPTSTSSSSSYTGKYAKEINAAASKHGVDPHLIAAIIQQESAFNPNARSHAGAQGLMQLMPATARSLGVKDSYNVSQNIDGGTKYIAQQLKAFGTLEKALAAYNAGPGNVRKYGGIPPFKETQNYVKKITGNYSGNGYSSSGSTSSSTASAGGQQIAGWDGRITSNYGLRTDPVTGKKSTMHHGIDLAGARGTPVGSSVGGKVVFAGMGTPGSGYNNYGNVVAVQDSAGDVHVFAHLDKVSAKKGATVGRGDIVGTIGSTGKSTGNHLHYEIRNQGKLGDTKNPQGIVSGIKSGSITSSGGSGSGEGVSVGIANKAQSKDNAQNEIIGIEGEIGSIDEQISKLRAEIINSQLAEYDREREKIEERLAEIDLEQSETYDSSPTWIKLQQEREKLIAKQLQQDENAKRYLEGEIKNNKNLTEAQISDLQDLLRQRNISISQVTQELNDVAFSVIEANLRAFTRKKEELQNEFDKLDYQMNREAEGTKKWIDLQLKREKLLQDEIKHDIDAIKYVKDQIKNNKNLNASQKEVLKNNLTDLQSEYWSKEQEILDARLKMVDQVTDAYKKALEAQRDAGVKVIDDLIAAIDKEASDEDYNKRLQKEYDKRQEIMDDIAKLSLDDSMGTQKQVEDLKKQLEEQNMSIEDMQTDRTRELRKDALNEQKDELTNKYDQILNDEEKFNKIREQMITGSNKAIIKDLNDFYKAVSGNKNIDKATQANLKTAIDSANSYLSGSKDISKIQQFNTGGYTGNNVPKSGALAILDNKELVLDKNDTKNFLEAVKEMRFLQNNGFIEKLKSSYIPGMNLSHLTSGLQIPKGITNNRTSTTTHSTTIGSLIGHLTITGDKKGADKTLDYITKGLEKSGIRFNR